MTRNEVYDIMSREGIYARKYFYPLTSDQECFGLAYMNNDLPVARELARQILCLPIYEGLNEVDIRWILDLISGGE